MGRRLDCEPRYIGGGLTVLDLQLSTRAHNALVGRGMVTVKQVASLTEKQVRRWPHVGPKTVKEIREALEDVGFAFQAPPLQARGDSPRQRINLVLAQIKIVRQGLDRVNHQLENLLQDLIK